MYIFVYRTMYEDREGNLSVVNSDDAYSSCTELDDAIINFLIRKDEQKPVYVKKDNQIIYYKLDNNGHPIETDKSDSDGIKLVGNLEFNKLYEYFAADNSEYVNEFIDSMPDVHDVYIETLLHAVMRVQSDYSCWLRKNAE